MVKFMRSRVFFISPQMFLQIHCHDPRPDFAGGCSLGCPEQERPRQTGGCESSNRIRRWLRRSAREIYCRRRGVMRTVSHAGGQRRQPRSPPVAPGRSRALAVVEAERELAANGSAHWWYSPCPGRGHGQITHDGYLDYRRSPSRTDATIPHECK